MPIEVACQCGRRFAARDDLAGKTVACPGCKGPLRIEAPRPASVPVEPTGVSSILDEIGLQTDERGIVCPKCQNRIAIGTSICTKCRYNLQTASFEKQPQAVAAPPTHVERYDWNKLRNTASSTGSVVDDELSWIDICLCVLCSPAAMLLGFVLFFQGRSKGILLILGSLLIPFLVGLMRLMWAVATMTPPPRKAELDVMPRACTVSLADPLCERVPPRTMG